MTSDLPTVFADGIRLFNAGDYFEAHEASEEQLEAVEEDGRWDLLVALIQVAVGYHKCASGHAGGERMLRMGTEKLAAFADVVWEIDVGALRRRTAEDVLLLAAGDSLAQRLADTPPRIDTVRV
jgi:uncharacterized protein